MNNMQYNFEWDPEKASSNLSKHKVSFYEAATIFKDPSMISIFDMDHSKQSMRIDGYP